MGVSSVTGGVPSSLNRAYFKESQIWTMPSGEQNISGYEKSAYTI